MSLAVVLGALASFVVGFIWYSPGAFGKMWMKLSGISKQDMGDAKKKGMMGNMVVGFIAQLVMAYVLLMFMNQAGDVSPAGGAAVAAWAWLGFVATIMVGSVLWEEKPVKLYVLNVAQWLVSLVVMGAVLGYMA